MCKGLELAESKSAGGGDKSARQGQSWSRKLENWERTRAQRFT